MKRLSIINESLNSAKNLKEISILFLYDDK